jgi:hypothetical protein
VQKFFYPLMWFDQNLGSRLVNFNNYRGGGSLNDITVNSYYFRLRIYSVFIIVYNLKMIPGSGQIVLFFHTRKISIRDA